MVSGPSALSWRQVFYKAMEFDGDAEPMENEVEGICIIPIHLYIEDIEVECFFIHFIHFIHFNHFIHLLYSIYSILFLDWIGWHILIGFYC